MLKDESKAPLLSKEEDEELEKYGLWASLHTICKLAIMPIIGMIFHPMYQLVNVAFIGRMDDATILAGLGLGSLTTGIMLLGTCMMYTQVMRTLIAQAHGAGDVRFCRVLLNRQYFLGSLVYAVLIIPVFFLKDIYKAIG